MKGLELVRLDEPVGETGRDDRARRLLGDGLDELQVFHRVWGAGPLRPDHEKPGQLFVPAQWHDGRPLGEDSRERWLHPPGDLRTIDTQWLPRGLEKRHQRVVGGYGVGRASGPGGV